MLYYSQPGENNKHAIGVASGPSPVGPFTDHGKLIGSDEIGVDISIDQFYIEEDGHKYMFWGSFRGIWAIELADDGLSLKPGAGKRKIAGDQYEGTYIHKRDGYYYLIVSTGDFMKDYHVVVGRSRSLMGPYVDRAGRDMLGVHHELVVGNGNGFVAPGHNAEFITDDKGQEPDDPARVRITVGTPDAPRPGRYASVNGAAPKRAAGLAGSFPAVVFDPGHLSLVKGAPEGRRRFLDAALCQLYPGYLATYRRYVRVLQQKNALLRHSSTGQERPYAEKCALLEVLNVELAAQGEVLQQRRRDYLALLGPLACANYQELSHGAERMSIRYAAQFAPGGLADLLKQRQNEELRAGQSLCGVHREDLELLLDDQPARVFASQGQQRSVVLSLKMAEAAAAARITGEHPVLLLDDVLSELDEGRKQYLLTRMKEKQTFVTSCDDTAFLKTDGEVYRMNGGVLSRA